MNVKNRVVFWLVTVGILCWVVVFVRIAFLSVAAGYLEYGIVLLGAVLIILAAALWKTSKSK
jgi:hypothetical protein